jgi:hypothetical protein
VYASLTYCTEYSSSIIVSPRNIPLCSHLIPLHSITSHLIASHCTTRIWLYFAHLSFGVSRSFHLISFHFISFRFVSFRFISFRPRVCLRVRVRRVDLS